MTNIRVRFAPSPTGYLHVGGARTALFNWLFARHHGGTFILRIEDTDVGRSKAELVTAILDSMQWLGLTWDEGPFYQSDRLARYRELATELARRGHAYRCFCTKDELDAKRAQAEAERRQSKYDRVCLGVPEAECARRVAAGQPYAVRFRVPDDGETVVDDIVFGPTAFANKELEDFVLLRSDGNPTYHLGVVADDLDMRITHVIRGADHLPNTPKQILVYRALDADVPRFAHVPLILGPDKQRLSKRHGATAVGAYRDLGILPEALVNFLVLLGWTPPQAKQKVQNGAGKVESSEIMSIDEMIRLFSLDAVSKANAVFDSEKLAWMNSEYLRHLPLERLLLMVEQELRSAGLWQDRYAGDKRDRFVNAVRLLQPRARTLKDFSESNRAFFTGRFEYGPEAVKKFWKDPSVADLLGALADRLAGVEPFDLGSTERVLRELASEKSAKAGVLINAARVALTGQAVAPGIFDVMVVLGREWVVERLRRAAAAVQRDANS
jgi:glutamyl-tRNA synthetase